MDHLLYLMFRCDRRCDGKFGKFENFVGTKHTQSGEDEKPRTHCSKDYQKHFSLYVFANLAVNA